MTCSFLSPESSLSAWILPKPTSNALRFLSSALMKLMSISLLHITIWYKMNSSFSKLCHRRLECHFVQCSLWRVIWPLMRNPGIGNLMFFTVSCLMGVGSSKTISRQKYPFRKKPFGGLLSDLFRNICICLKARDPEYFVLRCTPNPCSESFPHAFHIPLKEVSGMTKGHGLMSCKFGEESILSNKLGRNMYVYS